MGACFQRNACILAIAFEAMLRVGGLLREREGVMTLSSVRSVNKTSM